MRDAIFALFGFSSLWALMSMFLMWRRFRRMGLSGTQGARLLSGPRPSDPDELFVWRSTLHMCCAILIGVVCVLVLVFAFP